MVKDRISEGRQRMYRGKRNSWFKGWQGVRGLKDIVDILINTERTAKEETFLIEVKGVKDVTSYRADTQRMRQLLDGESRGYSLTVGVAPPTYDEIEENKGKDIVEIIREYIGETQGLDEIKAYIRALYGVKMFKTEGMKASYEANLGVWMSRYLREASETTGDKPYIAMFWGELTKKEEEFIGVLACVEGIDIVHFATVGESLVGKMGMESLYVLSEGEEEEGLREIPGLVIEKGKTTAYKAERELDTLLYTDTSGVYRPQQYQRVNSVVLQTTYDEIGLLWEQEAKYRPSFEAKGKVVRVGNIFAKVEGVDTRGIEVYQESVRKFVGRGKVKSICSGERLIEDITSVDDRGMRVFVYNKELDVEKLRGSKYYKYGIYTEETQQRVDDKVQEMLEMDWGRYDPNIIYKIIGVGYNLPREIMQMLHQYDYTGQIPKIVVYSTDETPISLEDSLAMMLLSKMGFDILVLVPTGYRVIEQYIDESRYNKLVIGGYSYEMPSTLDGVGGQKMKGVGENIKAWLRRKLGEK